MASRWTHRPEGSNWGNSSPGDQLGRLSLITPERVRAAAQEIQEGVTFCLSLLLCNFGRVDAELAHNRCAVLNRHDSHLLRWITDGGLAVLIADNFAVEASPALRHENCCAAAPLHKHCLFKLGVYLGEMWHLTPLAKWLRQRHRFRFSQPHHRAPAWRATASPVTPIATV
jgi:hypothetical protein